MPLVAPRAAQQRPATTHHHRSTHSRLSSAWGRIHVRAHESHRVSYSSQNEPMANSSGKEAWAGGGGGEGGRVGERGGGGGASRRADGQGVIGWGGRPGSRRVQLPALSSNFTPPTQLLLASALPHARPHTLFFSNASPSRMLNTCRKEVLPPGARHGRDGWGTLAGLGVAAAAPARQTTARGAAQGAVQHKPW